MPAPKTIYCIDTSSIIKWYVEEYPPSIFEGLRDRVEQLIAAGRLRAPKAVFDEIKPGDDCYKWCKAQTDLFVEESVAVQNVVRAIMASHHNKQKPYKGISGGDPFVIAMAKNGGADWIVVADENPGSAENRKIPYVCNAEGVTCVNFQERKEFEMTTMSEAIAPEARSSSTISAELTTLRKKVDELAALKLGLAKHIPPLAAKAVKGDEAAAEELRRMREREAELQREALDIAAAIADAEAELAAAVEREKAEAAKAAAAATAAEFTAARQAMAQAVGKFDNLVEFLSAAAGEVESASDRMRELTGHAFEIDFYAALRISGFSVTGEKTGPADAGHAGFWRGRGDCQGAAESVA